MTWTHAHHSAPFQVPYSQQYEPISLSFYADRRLDVRHFFEIWQTAVININDNSVNFYDEYTQDVQIWQLDRRGFPTYRSYTISVAIR